MMIAPIRPYGACLGWDGVWELSHFPDTLLMLSACNAMAVALFAAAAVVCSRAALDRRLGFRRSIGLLAALLWLSAAIFATRELAYFEPWFWVQAIVLGLAAACGCALFLSLQQDGLRRWLGALGEIERASDRKDGA